MYLIGRKLFNQTDQKPFKFLSNCRHQLARLQQWSLFLHQFDSEIEYIKGTDNLVADYLFSNNNDK